MNLLNLFDILDTVSAEKRAETPAGIPPAVQVSQADGQPATIVVPVATTDEVEVLEDDHEDSLELGDEVIITGNVQYQGKTGRIVDFGRNKHFLIVDLYNFGKHSFHSSNVEHNDYADSEEEDADWRERDHGLFGDDERDEDLNEGFGAYYYEQLAQKVFDLNPNLSTEGRCEELLKAAFPIAVQDLGKKGAQWKFNYDEDFPSDFVSAYAYLQGDGEQGVAEGEYDDPRWEPREPDMSRKVDWDIEAERNAPEEPGVAMTVTVRDAQGNVVLQFPSTGGFYGDKKYAASKGYDTESGDYKIKWKKTANEGNNWLDTPVSEEFDRMRKLAGLK